MNVIEASGLGKRYGGTWALRDCSLAIPAGHVAALVGPNGAGKSTLLNLAVGLAAPSAGGITVLGGRRPGSPAALDGIAFVAQDTPLYKNLSVADMLHLTRNLNRQLRPGIGRSPARRAGHPAEAQGRPAVRWPAGAARADAGAGPAAAVARARRADGDARPDCPPRLHGIGAHRGGRRRHVGAAVLARARRARTGRRLPHRVVAGPGAGSRRGRRPARRPPHADRPGRRGRQRTPSGPSCMSAGRRPRRTSWCGPPRTIRSRRAGRRIRSVSKSSPSPTCASPAPPRCPARARSGRRTVGGYEMTAHATLTAPAHREDDANLRPVPWRRMAWVTWRQHRIALGGAAAFLGALAAVPVARRPSAAPRLRRRHHLPSGRLTCLHEHDQRLRARPRPHGLTDSGPAAGGAGA